MPEDMSDRMPEDMSEYMPEDMPDRMPDRMPENMSDRMPEDLPVTKCINVMVGITRSKVIYMLFFVGSKCHLILLTSSNTRLIHPLLQYTFHIQFNRALAYHFI